MSELAVSNKIESLMAGLASRDRRARRQARETLVAIGQPSVASLLTALNDPNQDVRWEAIKALGEICDPAAAEALVKSLEDEAVEVRWRAAESLIALRYEGLIPLLRALIQRSDSIWLRERAHQVLHSLAEPSDPNDLVTPVLKALEDVEPAMVAPVAASTALRKLTASANR